MGILQKSLQMVLETILDDYLYRDDNLDILDNLQNLAKNIKNITLSRMSTVIFTEG
jgi:hypothetical protein